MEGVEKGLKLLETSLDRADPDADEASEPSDPTADLTLEEARTRARAMRLVGMPGCFDIHKDFRCRCCVFDT